MATDTVTEPLVAPLDAPQAVVCHDCISQPPPFDGAVAAVGYGFPWDGLIPQLKFHAALDLVPTFARLIAEAHGRSGHALPSLLVPVPLSRERLRERGFNQAWALTRRIAARLGCKADATLLLRMRDSPHQLGVPLAERADNVRGAFAVEPRRRTECAGLDIAVIDDVMTTGSTAAEISRTLRQAGVARVSIWVLARTPKPGDE